MLAFLLKRLATLVPTLIGITLVAFGLIRLVPGDPIEVMMGERRLDPEAHAALVKRMGLDQPLPVQYLDYVGKLLHGDLGQSLVSREPVSKEFAALFPATVELATAALIFAVGLGLLLGVTALLAWNQSQGTTLAWPWFVPVGAVYTYVLARLLARRTQPRQDMP